MRKSFAALVTAITLTSGIASAQTLILDPTNIAEANKLLKTLDKPLQEHIGFALIFYNGVKADACKLPTPDQQQRFWEKFSSNEIDVTPHDEPNILFTLSPASGQTRDVALFSKKGPLRTLSAIIGFKWHQKLDCATPT